MCHLHCIRFFLHLVHSVLDSFFWNVFISSVSRKCEANFEWNFKKFALNKQLRSVEYESSVLTFHDFTYNVLCQRKVWSGSWKMSGIQDFLETEDFSIFPARHAIPFHVRKSLPRCNNYGGTENQEMALQVLECLSGLSVQLKYESKCDSRKQL